MALPIDITAVPLETSSSAIAGFPLIIDISGTPLETYFSAGATRYPYVYVVDSGNHRVQAFDYNGNFAFAFGSYGTGNGQFNTPYGVAFDGTYIYITDKLNNRVQVFTPLGVYVTQFGSYGTALGQFSGPMGIHVDARYVWVIDNGNNRFQVFSKSGYIAFYELGELGSGVNQFNSPTDCYGDIAYFHIVDAGNNRTVTYSKNLNIRMYGNVTLPAFTVNATIHNNHSSASIILPSLTVASPGATIATGRVSHGSVVLPGITVSGSMRTGRISRGSVVFPAFTINGTIRTGRTTSGNIVLPAFTVAGQIITGHISSGAVVFPSIIVLANSYRRGITTTYEGMTVNMRNKAITKYDSMIFNSLAVLDGSLYGASVNGIHLVAGDDDNGTDILAKFKTGRYDLHESQVRRLIDIWLTLRNTGRAKINLYEDENDAYDVTSYPVIIEDAKIHEERIDLSDGHKGRFVEIEFENEAGADFDVNGMTIRVKDKPRAR